MLNILKSEFLKLKKDSMFFTGTIISLLIPVLLIIKDQFLSVPPSDISEWVMTCCLINFLVLPALSGFIITNLVQKEYQSGTLTNILSAAVSRASFVFAKLAVWFLWYVLLLVYIEIMTVLGGRLLYPAQFSSDAAKMIIAMFTKFGLLTFVTLLPLLWVTILQRKLFYPSILVTIVFTGILVSGFNISAGMILPASIIPWTAVSLTAVYKTESLYTGIGIISIVLTGIGGLFLALRSIYKQDQ